MKTSLFNALRNYRPRENKDSLENFITEAFAWLLINADGFSGFYMSKICERMQIKEVESTSSLEWSTQVHLGGVFPDLICSDSDRTFIFEHKAWAHLHPEQLVNYRREAEKAYGVSGYHIILVTGGRHQFAQDPDLAICWHEVHAWISEWITHKDYVDQPLLTDFQTLLKNEGMGPPAPISHESVLAFKPAQSLKPSLQMLVQRAGHYDWKFNFPKAAPDPKLPWHRSLPGGEDPWGRIGINLAGDIDSGPFVCFLGFLIDPKDHLVEWLNPTCPDFTVILGARPHSFPMYFESDQFKELVKALPAKIEATCPEFFVLDHFATSDNPNLWHPIHIRMPMLELLRGTTTADEQYERFIESASRLLSSLESMPEFIRFIEFLPSIRTK